MVSSMAKKSRMDEVLLRAAKAHLRSKENSIYRLAELSGVDRAGLSRFVNGKRGLTLSSAADLAEVLGLELRPMKGR